MLFRSKGKAEIPVVTRESRRNSRKTTGFPPLGMMSPRRRRAAPTFRPSPRRRGKRPFSKCCRCLGRPCSLGSPDTLGSFLHPGPALQCAMEIRQESHPQLLGPREPGAQGGGSASLPKSGQRLVSDIPGLAGGVPVSQTARSFRRLQSLSLPVLGLLPERGPSAFPTCIFRVHKSGQWRQDRGQKLPGPRAGLLGPHPVG